MENLFRVLNQQPRPHPNALSAALSATEGIDILELLRTMPRGITRNDIRVSKKFAPLFFFFFSIIFYIPNGVPAFHTLAHADCEDVHQTFTVFSTVAAIICVVGTETSSGDTVAMSPNLSPKKKLDTLFF